MTKSCALKGGQKVFQLHLNQAASCCRSYPVSLSKPESIDSLIKQWDQESLLLNRGVELESCQHCWDHENQGVVSYRQQASPTWGNTNLVELFIDNTCNQMCSYCSPKFSSSWQKSIKQQGMFKNISASSQKNLALTTASTDPTQKLWQIFDYINQCDDNSVTLNLAGGEPLMQIKNLQRFLKSNSAKIARLQITTNLNPPSAKFLHWTLNSFPREKLFFQISLDTVPEHNSIPRAGFDRQKFENNLALLKYHDIKFCFLSVISVLNIFSLNEFQTWLTQKGYDSKFFRLNNPDCLDPCYLPQQFKEKLLTQNLPDLAFDALQQQPNMIDIKQFEQYNYLKQYFERTATQITDSGLAEYWSWLEDKFK
jgi:organic radical activating enzyme